MKKIEIIVDTKGQTKVETKGFSGSECVEASRFIEQALGKSASQRTTAEFFNVESAQQQRASNGDP